MNPSSDHDLLIQIDTKLNLLTEQVKAFPIALAEKADRDDFVELKHEVTQLQKFKWTLLGGLVALQAAAEYFLHVTK